MEFSSPRRDKFCATNFAQKAHVEAAAVATSPDDSSGASNLYRPVEKEAMFEKVVTPSDVGKLNRLVIPKQHAEKYFPLDAPSIPADEKGKGRQLVFEDRCGTAWRFRYSYWRSSQSYVITKGWSRFVKDKRLHAGDTVSFARGLDADSDSDSGRQYRFYIDWKHQPPKQYAVNDFALGFSSPQQPLAVPWVWQRRAYGFASPSSLSGGGRQLLCFRLPLAPSTPTPNCVPARDAATAIKRVRLFGVNLDYAGTGGVGCPSASATTTPLQCTAPPANTLELLKPPRAGEETALGSSSSLWWSSPISKEQRPPLEYLYL